MEEKIEELAKTISLLGVEEMLMLSRILETQHGVTIEYCKEEPVRLKVVLQDFGMNKLAVVRILRDTLQVSLLQAKEMAEAAPCTVKNDATLLQAVVIAQLLNEAGANVRVLS